MKKEETKNELKPETEGGVKLTDEQMDQVSGGDSMCGMLGIPHPIAQIQIEASVIDGKFVHGNPL